MIAQDEFECPPEAWGCGNIYDKMPLKMQIYLGR